VGQVEIVRLAAESELQNGHAGESRVETKLSHAVCELAEVFCDEFAGAKL